ncbi:membrane integrity-associated transporter subunit PqiC [Pseudomonas sp. NPDC078700]|uniref:membrane integrity-associated transporter subunit PqiC n=1 Tax=Pseudomonas sp. NPDC078700 TaxID=3364424 RepID=UPI0037CB6E53
MTAMRLPLILLVTLLGLAGCARYQPVPLYQLDSGDAKVPSAKDGLAVLLGPVSIADYLQREALLQRQADGSLIASRDARWAGSLAADIDQQLLLQLSSQLNSQRLALAPAAPGFAPQIQILMSIARLDSGPDRPAVLEAQWRLMSKNGQLLDGRLVRLEQAHGGTIADQVHAQSTLMHQLVEQVAVAVKEQDGELPVIAEQTPKKAPAAAPKKEDSPKIPMAQPIRIDSEVYRF